ncbi:MAG: DUF1570 domain-containing protein [Planctomycetaceae bacterium]|nr:DUF1570 domain-containing protein [Planctomycetaceae bacterium]
MTLKDGTVYEGVLQSKTSEEIEFVEIFLRPGMPMSATVRVIAPGRVRHYAPLPERERQLLQTHVHRLRHRLEIEVGNQQQVQLAAASENSPHNWEYVGTWFQLASTADEESTRRCIVRIEQAFRAFRQLIPPTATSDRRLQIVLFGSVDEYQTTLRTMGVEIENLAFYAAREKTIFAGAEIVSYAERLTRIRTAHQELLRDLVTEAEQVRISLKDYSDKLAKQGLSREQIKEELSVRNAAWNREKRFLERRISETDRRNDATFREITTQMFRRLYHEAFHAYLDGYVMADRPATIDRWLNEGLAQIFESGQFEGDTLRIDAPNSVALAHLQRDLASTNPLSLSELLMSSDKEFLAAHARPAATRHYAYAWGLAYYLSIETQVINRGTLAELSSSHHSSPLERFQSVVGKPLDEFEREWRRAMLALPLR